jgi:hypothetical protein
MKTCKVCNLEFDYNNFYKSTNKDGLKNECKNCYNNKRSDYNKRYKLENKEKQILVKKIYYINNKEYLMKKHTEYLNKRYKNDILFRLQILSRSSIKNIFINKNIKKKSKTKEIIGCSFEELRTYLENKFEPWMNWGNQGRYNGEFDYGWDIDHIIPLSSAKNEEDIIKLSHYSNLQPLCSKVNRDIKKDIWTQIR